MGFCLIAFQNELYLWDFLPQKVLNKAQSHKEFREKATLWFAALRDIFLNSTRHKPRPGQRIDRGLFKKFFCSLFHFA